MGKCKKISCGLSTLVSIVLIVVGISVLVGVIPKTLRKKLEESLPFRNGTDSGDRFIESPVITYSSYYVYNVTNMDDVNKNGSVPELQELGPYVFRQVKIKEGLIWNASLGSETTGLVSYKERTTYFFEPDKTKGTLEDEVNHVNMVSMMIFRNMASINKFFDPQYSEKDIKGQLIETHTVGQLLFEGVDMRPYLNNEKLTIFCLKDPKTCPFAFNLDNNTNPLPYVVATGTDNLDDIAKIRSYQGKTKLTYWYGDKCNELKGTDGKQFAPDVEEKDVVHVFSSDVCRTFKFIYEKDMIVEKIDTLRFAIPSDVFEDPNKNNDNMCFCPRPSNTGPCPSKSGVFSVEPCKNIAGLIDVPLAMSAPHFYQGSQEYVDNFKGLNPTKEKHQTFLDIEPLTGTVISGAKRLQVNIIVTKGGAAFQEHVDKDFYYFPAIWIQEGATIDPEKAEEFRNLVTKPYKTGKWSMVAIIAIGGVMLLTVVIFVCFAKRK